MTNSQLDTTNESQEVSPFPACDHKAHINRPVILFGHFYRLIWESFPIQKWPLFSQFHVFWILIFPIFMIYFPKFEGKGSFPKSQIKSLQTHKGIANTRKKLEHLKHSPDLLNNVKIGHGQLRLIIQTYFVSTIFGQWPFWSSDLKIISYSYCFI